MLKKQQKMIKINSKIVILMSEKKSVTLINKGFLQKYGKSSISIKTRIETLPFCYQSHHARYSKSSISIKIRIETF